MMKADDDSNGMKDREARPPKATSVYRFLFQDSVAVAGESAFNECTSTTPQKQQQAGAYGIDLTALFYSSNNSTCDDEQQQALPPPQKVNGSDRDKAPKVSPQRLLSRKFTPVATPFAWPERLPFHGSSTLSTTYVRVHEKTLAPPS
jgi:hypothetical protein